jgi:hypothetical protein
MAARALAIDGMALRGAHPRPGRRPPQQLNTEVAPKEQPVIAFQSGHTRICATGGRVIDRAAIPYCLVIVYGLQPGQNHEADDGPASESRIGILVITKFASILADGRAQPDHLPTELAGARKDLHFGSPSLGIPEPHRACPKSL